MVGGQNFGEAELLGELRSSAADAAEAALAEIYRQHGPAVLGLAERCAGDVLQAEQVATEVFVDLWCQRHSLPSQRSLRSYLIQAAYLRCMAYGELPRERGEDDAEADRWRQLPAEDRWAIGLAYFGQMSSRDVAGLLDVSEEAVKSRITRGLQRLAER